MEESFDGPGDTETAVVVSVTGRASSPVRRTENPWFVVSRTAPQYTSGTVARLPDAAIL